MAHLVFHVGTMNSGKSTLALQSHHARSIHGHRGALYSKFDRHGPGNISSRLHLNAPCVEVEEVTDLYQDVVGRLAASVQTDYVICDEIQFYSPAQVEQVADVVDRLGLDVYLFGILTDFRGRLFPASARAVELADTVLQMPVGTFCWCGAKGTHHARLVDGRMVDDGDTIVVGDVLTGSDQAGAVGTQVTYEVLCRKHHRMMAPDPNREATSSRVSATRS